MHKVPAVLSMARGRCFATKAPGVSEYHLRLRELSVLSRRFAVLNSPVSNTQREESVSYCSFFSLGDSSVVQCLQYYLYHFSPTLSFLLRLSFTRTTISPMHPLHFSPHIHMPTDPILHSDPDQGPNSHTANANANANANAFHPAKPHLVFPFYPRT